MCVCFFCGVCWIQMLFCSCSRDWQETTSIEGCACYRTRVLDSINFQSFLPHHQAKTKPTSGVGILRSSLVFFFCCQRALRKAQRYALSTSDCGADMLSTNESRPRFIRSICDLWSPSDSEKDAFRFLFTYSGQPSGNIQFSSTSAQSGSSCSCNNVWSPSVSGSSGHSGLIGLHLQLDPLLLICDCPLRNTIRWVCTSSAVIRGSPNSSDAILSVFYQAPLHFSSPPFVL